MPLLYSLLIRMSMQLMQIEINKFSEMIKIINAVHGRSITAFIIGEYSEKRKMYGLLVLYHNQ